MNKQLNECVILLKLSVPHVIFITILAWWEISAGSTQPHLYYHTFNNLLGRVINLSEFAKDCPDFKTESLRNLFKSKQIRERGHPVWRYPGFIFLLLIYCCLWCWEARGNLRMFWGDSLVVQWLGFCTSTEGDVGLLLGQVTKILHAAQKSKKKKKMFCAIWTRNWVRWEDWMNNSPAVVSWWASPNNNKKDMREQHRRHGPDFQSWLALPVVGTFSRESSWLLSLRLACWHGLTHSVSLSKRSLWCIH